MIDGNVIVDVDDVLIDYNDSVARIIRDDYAYTNYDSKNIVTYSLNKDIDLSLLSESQRMLEDNGLGCPRGLILSLYSDLRTFLNAKIVDNAYEGLDLLCKNFSNVTIYTSSWSFDIIRFKLNLFEEIFSDLDLSYSFHLGKDKSAYKDVYAVFEDSLPNMLKYESSCKKILVDRPQNCELFNSELISKVNNLNRAKNFYDGVEYLLKEV